jgi:predicted aldo/keto reductase-like oxidoreductase
LLKASGSSSPTPPPGGGALLRPTPADPPEFVPPPAPAWYRFVLRSPAVSVVLAAPHTRAELDEDLEILSAAGPLPADEYESLARHGERVRAHAGRFP